MMVSLLIFLSLIFWGSKDVGTTAFPMLKIGYNPRPSAMGGSYVALANDASCVWWNPAGLGIIESGELSFCHQHWFQNIRDEYLTATVITPYGRFGSSLFYSATPGVGYSTKRWEWRPIINVWSAVLSLSYGFKLTENLAIGTAFKTVYQDLEETNYLGFGFDIAALHRISEQWNFGINLQNIGPPIQDYSLPLNLRTGLVYEPFKNLLILGELNIPRDNEPEIHTGAEFTIGSMLSLRAGYRGGPLGGLTAGAGINISSFKIDYAWVPYGDLGLTHRISLSLALPEIEKTTWFLLGVLDKDTDEPIEALVEIIAPDSSWEIYSTNYEIKNPVPGDYEITATKEGYHSGVIYFDIPFQKSIKKVIKLSKIKPCFLNGCVYDIATKEPVPSIINYGNSETKSASFAGEYSIKFEPGKHHLVIKGINKEYIPITCDITIDEGETKNKDFYLMKPEKPVIFENIHFETGCARLLPKSYSSLNYVGKILSENSNFKLEISGHTDSREIHTSVFPSNLELSIARAKSAKLYLIQKFNIVPDRIIAKGYGAESPIAPNDFPDKGMAKNRRVEFKIITRPDSVGK